MMMWFACSVTLSSCASAFSLFPAPLGLPGLDPLSLSPFSSRSAPSRSIRVPPLTGCSSLSLLLRWFGLLLGIETSCTLGSGEGSSMSLVKSSDSSSRKDRFLPMAGLRPPPLRFRLSKGGDGDLLRFLMPFLSRRSPSPESSSSKVYFPLGDLLRPMASVSTS
uniref:Putative secreted protein n=1 Tax=Ixodes ricinus TaxID=34613 RepID=A0A6B0UX49_IXORI